MTAAAKEGRLNGVRADFTNEFLPGYWTWGEAMEAMVRTGRDISARAGAPAAAGDPVAYYSAGTNTKHVVYRSADGRLHDLRWVPGGVPTHVDLTTVAGAPQRGKHLLEALHKDNFYSHDREGLGAKRRGLAAAVPCGVEEAARGRARLSDLRGVRSLIPCRRR